MNRRLRYLSTLHSHGPPAGVPDAELLARWVASGDEAAFELLVRRHAPMVLAACRRLLRDAADADDAFQAAFLVLARKAASVARGAVLAAWLHRVAVRAALRVRTERFKRAGRQEEGAVDRLPAPSSADPAWSELLRVLDEEIERLPARHRAAFVLCCLEGKTGEEAGRLLGCPAGTVSSRLTRARERLRDRLTRRGFAPAALIVIGAGSDALAATVPDAALESVLRSAPAFSSVVPPSGPPTRSATLAEGVLRTMFVNKLRLISVLLAAGLLVVGAALAGTGSDPDRDGDRDPTPRPSRPAAKAAIVPAQAEDQPPAVPIVRLAKVQQGGLDRVSNQSCVVEAGLQAHLFPTVTGVLKRADMNIGDRVKAGQLLAEIDAPLLALDERQAVAGVAQAEGLLKEAEARVTTAKAEIVAAKGTVQARQTEETGAKAAVAFRKKQFARLQALADAKATGQDLVDESADQLRVAEALAEAATVGVANAKTELMVKESKLDQAGAGIGTARANVEAAKIGLERARLAAAQARITAPFDGLVAQRKSTVGEFVRSTERADVPLFTIVRTDTVRVVIAVSQRDLAAIEPGQVATVEFPAQRNVRVTGKVARVGVTLDPGTASARVEVDLPNPKGDIRPGMFGTVIVKLGDGPADAVRVSREAVVQVNPAKPGDSRTAVYVYKDGKARLTPVRVGYESENEIEVTSGLTAGDLVVIDPRALGKTEIAVEVEKPAPPK